MKIQNLNYQMKYKYVAFMFIYKYKGQECLLKISKGLSNKL